MVVLTVHPAVVPLLWLTGFGSVGPGYWLPSAAPGLDPYSVRGLALVPRGILQHIKVRGSISLNYTDKPLFPY